MWPGPTWADEKSENELKLNNFLHSLLFDKKMLNKGFSTEQWQQKNSAPFPLKTFFSWAGLGFWLIPTR